MISRRDVLSALVAGAARLIWKTPVLFAKASQPSTKINFAVPSNSCDCHVHIFDPQQFPFVEARGYTPEVALIDELRAVHKALHMDRVVVIQPSVYGTDNRCTLDAIRKLGSRARGVAVIDEKTTEVALDEMNRIGIRGIRLNFNQAGIADPAAARQRVETAIQRVKPRNWHIQINTVPAMIEALAGVLSNSPVPIVFDHFGGALEHVGEGTQQKGFAAAVNLVKSGKAYVKISAAADQTPDHGARLEQVSALARALVSANPQRVVWGTNWPHPDAGPRPGRKNTDLAPLQQTDDGRILNLLPGWVPDAPTRQMILVENPAKLYGF
jgi:predicted TIM-barrel fold metal-dependent hydrolase